MTDDKITAVTAALVGRVEPVYTLHTLQEGSIFRALYDATPEYLNPFEDDNYQCGYVDLVAHCTGVLTGIVYVDKIPVALQIEPLSAALTGERYVVRSVPGRLTRGYVFDTERQQLLKDINGVPIEMNYYQAVALAATYNDITRPPLT